MNCCRIAFVGAALGAGLIFAPFLQGQHASPTPKIIAEIDCTKEKLGPAIAAGSIGEPVSAVTLNAPQWHPAAGGTPAYCSVEGSMAPVDKSAPPIRFAVALPASWTLRAAQLGGGGMNGMIPRLTGGVGRGGQSLLELGFATYGSDSGHQMNFGIPGGAARGGTSPGQTARGGMPLNFGAPNPATDGWALNEEAIANLGYVQLKKTHDAAMVLIQRM